MNNDSRLLRAYQLALFLLTLNWVGLTVEIFRRGNTPIHFYYESIGFKILLIANLPAITIAEYFSEPTNLLIESRFAPSLALPFIGLISLQWVLVSVLNAQICKRWAKRAVHR